MPLMPVGFPNVAIVPSNVVGAGAAGTTVGGSTISNPQHITVAGTTTVVPPGTPANTALRLTYLSVIITGTPSAETVIVRVHNAPQIILLNLPSTSAAMNTPTVVPLPPDGVVCAGGIDIVVAGTTIGATDVQLNYR